MPDLDERFRSLSRAGAPDLWGEIEERLPGPLPEPALGPRLLVSVVALLVAFAGLAGLVVVFRAWERPQAGAVTNGKIAFVAFDGSTWQIYSAEPDGTALIQLTHVADPVMVGEPAWSPDGSRLAYVVQGSDSDGTTGRSDIWIMNTDGTDAHAVTDGPSSSWSPAWSPDGSAIAFTRGSNIYLMDAEGIHATNITSDPENPPGAQFEPTWSPDGEHIAFVGRGGDDDLYVMRSDGADVRLLFSGPGYQSELAWSPSGSTIAFANVTEESGTDVGRFTLIDQTGTVVGRLSGLPPMAQAPTWSPDGRLIAFMANVAGSEREAIYLMNADGTDIRPVPGLPMNASFPAWQPIPVEQPTPTASPTPPVAVPKANGPIYFRIGERDGSTRIEAVEPDGTGRRVVFDGEPLRITQIAWSPDGSRIAYRDPIAAERGIYVANPDGSAPVRLTDGANDAWPSWSPNGSKILFSSSRYDPSIEGCEPGVDFRCPTDIYVMDADGSGVVRLTDDQAPEYQPVWSPGGDRIAFVRPRGGTIAFWEAPAIFSMNADGTEVRQVSSGDGGSDFSPSWSPDGEQLAFSAFRFEDSSLFVVEPDGTGERSLLSVGYVADPVWSPDGRLLAFVGNDADGSGSGTAIYVMSADGTNVTQLASIASYEVTPDIAWQPIPTNEATTEPTPEPSPTEPASIEVSVTTIGGIGPFPNAVVVGEGAIWVSAPRDDGSGGGDLVRIDPSTAEIVARIPLEGLPTWEIGGAGMATGLGSVWVISQTNELEVHRHAVLQRVDPSANDVAEVIDLGPADMGADVWVDASAIWALVGARDGAGLEALRIDPVDHQVTSRTAIPAFWSQTIFVAGGWTWVLATAPNDKGPVEANTLYKIDPSTGELVGTVNLGGFVWGLVVDADAIWIRDVTGVLRLDPITGQPLGQAIPPTPGCCTGAFVPDGAGGVWIGSRLTDAGGEAPALWHIDASGAVIAEGAIDPVERDAWFGVAYAYDPFTNTIWMVHLQNSVSRIELLES